MSYASARKELLSAKKMTTKTLFRWNPDWFGAAPVFDRAASTFKRGGHYEDARDAYILAAEAHSNCDSFYPAGQCYEKAAQAAEKFDEGDPLNTAAELYGQSCSAFRAAGDIRKASKVNLKAAQVIEEISPARSLELMLESCSMMEDESPALAASTFRDSLNFALKCSDLAVAKKLLTDMVALYTLLDQTQNVWKCFLGEIVLCLASGDAVAAEVAFHKHLDSPRYGLSPEAEASENLLNAVKAMDEEALDTAKGSRALRYLENQLALLSRRLTINGMSSALTPSSSVSSASASRAGAGASASGAKRGARRPSQSRSAAGSNSAKNELFAGRKPKAAAPATAAAATASEPVAAAAAAVAAAADATAAAATVAAATTAAAAAADDTAAAAAAAAAPSEGSTAPSAAGAALGGEGGADGDIDLDDLLLDVAAPAPAAAEATASAAGEEGAGDGEGDGEGAGAGAGEAADLDAEIAAARVEAAQAEAEFHASVQAEAARQEEEGDDMDFLC